MRTIYLAGPINGCTDAEAMDWRQEVQRRLGGRFRYLDPMRRDYRGREDESVAEIVHGDLQDIDASDVFLALADRPSWGTGMEIHYAARRAKHVVVVCGAERVSPWLRYHASVLVRTVDEAIEYLCASS